MSDDPLLRKNSTTYDINEKIREDGKNTITYLFVVAVSGTSASSKPDFTNVTKPYTSGDYTTANSVVDGTVTWIAEKIYESTDQELYWEVVGDWRTGDEIDNLFNNVTNTMAAILPWLDIAVVAVDLAKFFITSGVSPVLAAFSFILAQLVSYIKDIRREGFHFIFIHPNQNLFTKFINLEQLASVEQPEKFLFTDQILTFEEYKKKALATSWAEKVFQFKDPNAKTTSPLGVYTLTTAKAMKTLKASFSDQGDPNRPPQKKDAFAGGICIHIGVTGNIPDLLGQIKIIYKFFNLIFDNADTKAMYNKFRDLEAQKEAKDKKYTDEQRTALSSGKSDPPDWVTYRAAEILGYDFILKKVELFLQGMKDNVDLQSDKMKAFTDFLTRKIEYLESLIDEIEEFISMFNEVRDALNALEQQIRIMYIEPQDGGIEKFKRAIDNPEITNSPDPKTEYTIMGCILGSGTAFSIFANAVLPNTAGGISFAEPSDTITNSDKLMKRFKIGDEAALAEFDERVKNRIEDRASYFEDLGMDEEAQNYRDRDEFSRYYD